MDGRWWENYFVRYLVGTVVGALLVLFLLSSERLSYHAELAPLLKIRDDLKEDSFLGAGLAGALGFAFCYVASAPILTVHTLRAHFRGAVLSVRPWRHLVVLDLSIVGFIWLAWDWVRLPIFAAVVVGLILGVQVAALISAALDGFRQVGVFYSELATRRSAAMSAERPSPGAEYITSYRHLREHGNAFKILLMEGALAYLLFWMPSAFCGAILLVIWIAPAAIVWTVGTVLESRFVRVGV